jgi:hypothetical protein
MSKLATAYKNGNSVQKRKNGYRCSETTKNIYAADKNDECVNNTGDSLQKRRRKATLMYRKDQKEKKERNQSPRGDVKFIRYQFRIFDAPEVHFDKLCLYSDAQVEKFGYHKRYKEMLKSKRGKEGDNIQKQQ